MAYSTVYLSPVGALTLASDGENLTGLWREGQKYFGGGAADDLIPRDGLPLFGVVKGWLARYFAGENPAITDLLLAPAGSAFRQAVWELLKGIPYGGATTYGALAARLGGSASARAVGGAVGHNPISIIIPCHRVIGADGSLTGYAGGIQMKTELLRLEGYL